MVIIFDLVFLIIGIIFLPVYLFRQKFHAGFPARLGSLPKGVSWGNPLWVHAVSVGEVKAVSRLVEELRKIYPDKKIVISTVTPTGNKIAKSFAQENDFVTYLPLDLSFIVRRVLDRVDPCLFIIAETEIWPNLLSYLSKKGIPSIVVNGRISDGSFRGYSAIRCLIKPILAKIHSFCVQTQRDAERLEYLGVPTDKVHVTGNMKFDIPPAGDGKEKDTRMKLGLSAEDKLFVCGSTHPKEEEILLGVYRELLKDFPSLKLLLAPRHPERGSEVVQIVSGSGFRGILVSTLPKECSTCLATPVFILDKVGELVSFYAIADIVFVGGSLVEKGGHNLLEPVALGKPVLFGPSMFNFRDMKDLFLHQRAAIQVKDPQDLVTLTARILRNPDEAVQMAERGKKIILQHQGATHRNLEFIKKLLSGRCARGSMG
jgi:3-deoxy-D-manno-octulosonic-acid transferase